eukprot:gene21325-biopygen14682
MGALHAVADANRAASTSRTGRCGGPPARVPPAPVPLAPTMTEHLNLACSRRTTCVLSVGRPSST